MKNLQAETTEDLAKTIKENEEKLRILNFSMTGGKTKNTQESSNLRKEIARILTELRKRELAGIGEKA